MRYSKVIDLYRMFKTYFTRKVLNNNMLKNPIVRILTIIGFIIGIGALSILMYSFFGGIGKENNQIEMILYVYSSTIILWTSIIFIFLKILFLNSQRFLSMTLYFPITRKERNLALLIYEIVMTIIVILIISSTVVIALTAKYGITYLKQLIIIVLLTSFSYYLFLQLFYKVMSWINKILKLDEWGSFIHIGTYFILFILLYKYVQEVNMENINNFLDGEEYVYSLSTIWLMLSYKKGFAFTLICFVVLVIIEILGIVLLPDNTYLKEKRFYHIFIAKSKTKLSKYKSYFFTQIRRKEHLHIVLLIFISTIVTVLNKNIHLSSYLVILLSLNGIYSYELTRPLRSLDYKLNYNPIEDYIYLIISQVTVSLLFGGPIFALSIFSGSSFVDLMTIVNAMIVSTAFSTLTGILFPPEKENPFTVFTSFFIVLIFMLVFGMVFFILNLSQMGATILILLSLVFIVLVSIQGLNKIHEEQRNLKIKRQ